MSNGTLVFVDTETISLERDHRHLWEVALIVEHAQPPDGNGVIEDEEHVWILDDVPLGEADPRSLEIGRFYERYRPGILHHTSRAHVAAKVSELTRGHATLIGAVPSFDEERLWGLLRANGACPDWHYHLVDIETLIVGYAANGATTPLEQKILRPPWKYDELLAALGITVDENERHTALGDAKVVQQAYHRIMG